MQIETASGFYHTLVMTIIKKTSQEQWCLPAMPALRGMRSNTNLRPARLLIMMTPPQKTK